MANNTNLPKEIKYIGKDFNNLKQNLIDFAKTYYPQTYNDFTTSSPGMMFMEMSSYVGDVLSYYLDTQIQENFILFTKEKENLLNLAYFLGYTPKLSTAAVVELDVYQLLPSKLSGSTYLPDFDYTLRIEKEASITPKSATGVSFLTQSPINFALSSSIDPTEISVYQYDISNNPTYYLLKKKVKAISANIKTIEFSVGEIQKYLTINFSDSNMLGILDITDSDGNKWYEVPYLAQDTIFEEIALDPMTNPDYDDIKGDASYMLRLKKVSRRFVTRIKGDNSIDIQFGAGTSSDDDEVITPNPDNVGLGLVDSLSKIDLAYDPTNFIYTKTYGIPPSNTILTVRYLVGGGVEANVPSNTLNSKKLVTVINPLPNSSLKSQIIDSLAFNNPAAADGGKSGDTLDDIRLNSISAFSTQLRAVTKDDYLLRVLSMPARYGSIAKAFITKDDQLNVFNNERIPNPLALNLYVLNYDNSKKLTLASDISKTNLKTYLRQYRMETDAINILDGYIINVGLKFDITVLSSFNSQEVLVNCINALKTYFDISKWNYNQPILITDVINTIASIKGVQSVIGIRFENKVGEDLGYSKYSYDLESATKNGVIYPSMDPAIFEIKYPDQDIEGRVVTY